MSDLLDWIWNERDLVLALIPIVASFVFAIQNYRQRLEIRKSARSGKIREHLLQAAESELMSAALENDKLEKRLEEMVARSPDKILVSARTIWDQQKAGLALAKLDEWSSSSDGAAASDLLYQKAEWIWATAVGEPRRAAGAIIAEAFAGAARTICPHNLKAEELYNEVGSFRYLERQPPLDFASAFALLSDPHDLDLRFEPDDIETAIKARLEANGLWDKGFYRLSKLCDDRAIQLFEHHLGNTARQTLEAHVHRTVTFHSMARNIDALNEINVALQGYESNLELGLRHHDAFVARKMLGSVLASLGRYDKAEAVLRTLLDDQIELCPPNDPRLLSTKHAYAEILSRLKKSSEALSIIEEVIDARPEGERDDLSAFADQYLRARILTELGRYSDAKDAYSTLLKQEEKCLPKNHPYVSSAKHGLGAVHFKLGDVQAAHDLTQESIVISESNDSIGPDHPDTLYSRFQLAWILERMNRREEAKDIMREVVARQKAHQSLGPNHPFSLESKDFLNRLESREPDGLSFQRYEWHVSLPQS